MNTLDMLKYVLCLWGSVGYLLSLFRPDPLVQAACATFAGLTLDDEDLEEILYDGTEFLRIMEGMPKHAREAVRRNARLEYDRRWGMVGVDVLDVRRELAGRLAQAICAVTCCREER